MEVRRIKEFNLSFLDKWCWRLKDERESFWIRVLSAKYGEEGHAISEVERFASFVVLLQSLLFGSFLFCALMNILHKSYFFSHSIF